MPIVGMVVDVITPSLPAMVIGLQSSRGLIKTTVTLYLIGYALGNFFTGFLADAWGRYKLLHTGIVGFILLSSLPFFYPHVGLVLAVRALQGIATGCLATACRAILADILPPEKLVRMGTLIGTMWGLGPVLGPVIGGYLQFYFGWQASFLFLAIISLIVYIPILLVVPETHLHRHPLHINTIANNLREIFSHKWFMGLIIVMGCAYALLISFHILGPFLIEPTLHHSPVFFGHVALGLGCSFLAGTFISRHLLKKHPGEKLLSLFIHLFMAAAILGLAASLALEESLSLIIVISGLMFFCTGSLFPMSMGMGMSHFKHIAGTATAIMYLLNILITSLAAFVMSFINTHNTSSLMLVYTVLLLICALSYRVLIKRER
jgi:MFS family permease